MNFFNEIEESIKTLGLNIISRDYQRPWGGFLKIDESQTEVFCNIFFKNFEMDDLKITEKISPKILIINPSARLSWQYHNRRAEIWSVYKGKVGVVRSKDDNQKEMIIHKEGDQIILDKRERHRLVGTEDYCVIAEIWQHTNKEEPSNEEDIVRIQDDYGREK